VSGCSRLIVITTVSWRVRSNVALEEIAKQCFIFVVTAFTCFSFSNTLTCKCARYENSSHSKKANVLLNTTGVSALIETCTRVRGTRTIHRIVARASRELRVASVDIIAGSCFIHTEVIGAHQWCFTRNSSRVKKRKPTLFAKFACKGFHAGSRGSIVTYRAHSGIADSGDVSIVGKNELTLV